MPQVVSEQEKARRLLTLTEEDLGTSSYSFVSGTVARMSKHDILYTMTDRQRQWFDNLYDKHFGV